MGNPIDTRSSFDVRGAWLMQDSGVIRTACTETKASQHGIAAAVGFTFTHKSGSSPTLAELRQQLHAFRGGGQRRDGIQEQVWITQI
jgi:hypothetical protein